MKRILLYPALVLLLCACGGSRKTVTTPSAIEVPASKYKDGKGIDRKLASRLEKEARTWIGTKYKYGGETKRGTDCSGMVMSVFRDVAKIKLPRSSAEQQKFCKPVKKDNIAPGDLVFFSSSKKGRVTHVGLYIGNGDFIHASSSKGVMISNLSQDYYVRHFHSAGRVPSLKTSGSNQAQQKEDKPRSIDKNESVPAAKKEVRREEIIPEKQAPVPTPAPIIVTETIRVVERIVDTVYIPAPNPPVSDKKTPVDTLKASTGNEADSIRASVRKAMKF